MSKRIRVGIVGYGNLGRGVELALRQNEDFVLEAIFTRRSPDHVPSQAKALHISEADNYTGKIDVMILCGGSATDLPEQGPLFANRFTTVDSYDTHAKIPQYFAEMDRISRNSGNVSVISVGWDPGLFSLNRMMMEAILPEGQQHTFWGRGVSQGHSDAVRRVAGVKAGVQYTIPNEEAITRIRSGESPDLTIRDKHLRDCYIVAEDGESLERIEREIKEMPNYFADYHTQVTFISEQELLEKHSAMPHGGLVIRSGTTGEGSKQVVEFGLNLGSNPEFTASVLVAYARAAYRMRQAGQTGARTVYDIAPGLISPHSPEDLRSRLL